MVAEEREDCHIASGLRVEDVGEIVDEHQWYAWFAYKKETLHVLSLQNRSKCIVPFT